jgi:hypothetical protein
LCLGSWLGFRARIREGGVKVRASRMKVVVRVGVGVGVRIRVRFRVGF